MPSFGPLRLALPPPPRPCGPGCSAPASFLRASACRSSGRFRYRHRCATDSCIILRPLPEAVPSSSLRHPAYPLETVLDTFFVLRQKGAVFPACCAVSRALHLSKVLLSQPGFHRVDIPSYALPPPQPVRASVYRSSVIPCICVGGFPPPQRSGLRIRPSLRSDADLLCPLSALTLATGQAFTAAPTCGHGRGLASRPGCAGPGEGIDSLRLRLRSSMPGERGDIELDFIIWIQILRYSVTTLSYDKTKGKPDYEYRRI